MKTHKVKVVEQKKILKKEETISVNDSINSDMLALGLESNIPKISLKKKVGLSSLKEEEEKRRKEKPRLNIVVIGKNPGYKDALERSESASLLCYYSAHSY